MNLKKITILMILLLLTGCAKVEYKLNISKKINVTEELFITGTDEYFKLFYMNLPKTIVEETYNSENIELLKSNGYFTQIVYNRGRYPEVNIRKKYNNLDEYATKTLFKGQAFEDVLVKTNDNLVTIKTEKFIPYIEDQTDSGFPISNLSINIKLPFVVTKSNADKVDKSTNTYTWKIDEKTENKEINITFDKNKIYIYNISWYISLVIIIILAIIATIYIIKTIKKNKKNNFVD